MPRPQKEEQSSGLCPPGKLNVKRTVKLDLGLLDPGSIPVLGCFNTQWEGSLLWQTYKGHQGISRSPSADKQRVFHSRPTFCSQWFCAPNTRKPGSRPLHPEQQSAHPQRVRPHLTVPSSAPATRGQQAPTGNLPRGWGALLLGSPLEPGTPWLPEPPSSSRPYWSPSRWPSLGLCISLLVGDPTDKESGIPSSKPFN